MNSIGLELKNPFASGKVVGPIKDPAAYHTDEFKRGDPNFVMGRSDLMEFANCPLRWINGYESEESKATEWGSLVDCLFLTPGEFKRRYAVAPETYPDAKTGEAKAWNLNSTWCKEWVAQQQGKEVIKSKLFGPACDAVKVLQSDPDIKALRECSQTQVMAAATYHDPETDLVVPVHILIDMMPAVDSDYGKALADLKTCNCAAVRAWNRAVFDHGYAVQAAFYLDVWTMATGEDRVDFLHVVQESFTPYQTEKRMLSAEFIEIGRAKYQSALAKYCACLKSGIWPGYGGARVEWNGWQMTEPEPWMVQ